MGVAIGIALGLLIAKPAVAAAPTIESKELNPPYDPTLPKDITPIPKPSVVVQPKNPTRITTGAYSGRHYSKEEVIQLIKDYSITYGIDAALPLSIARCESGFNHLAKNKTSTASGVFQYLSGTWAGTDEAKAGLSVFDADANVRAAIKYIASRGHAAPWNASKGCWNT